GEERDFDRRESEKTEERERLMV
ncbi:hypothetical protein CCACVL1_18094, partial [Corchorus capsularis]